MIRLLDRVLGSQRRTALEALRTNVMIADANLQIVYMNPSVIKLMHEAGIYGLPGPARAKRLRESA